jgi:hypothetical protein
MGARDASPLKKGVRSREYCVSGTTETIEGEVVCGETTDVSKFEGLLGEPHASGIPVVVGHKQVR